VAGVFVILVPSADKVNSTSGAQFIILRWFHSVCWVLIALNFFVRASGKENLKDTANLLGTGGGIAYALYLINFVQINNS
jgi:hypothetical protein